MPRSRSTAPPLSEVALFGRLIKAKDGTLAPDLARYLLTLGFDQEDQARMKDLAERNQDGALSREEQQQPVQVQRPPEAVLGDVRAAPALVEHGIAAAGAQGVPPRNPGH